MLTMYMHAHSTSEEECKSRADIHDPEHRVIPSKLNLVTSRDRSGSQVVCSPQKIFFFSLKVSTKHPEPMQS